MSEHETNKPWFKQLWPWLLISGPAVAAIGCVIRISSITISPSVRDACLQVTIFAGSHAAQVGAFPNVTRSWLSFRNTDATSIVVL